MKRSRGAVFRTLRNHRPEVLALILAVSVLLRVAVALYLGNVADAPPMLTDQRSYHALGARLISGHGFSFHRYWYPFTPAETPTAHWSFLYSLYIAGIYAVFGVQPLAARLMGAVLGGILLPLAVFRWARCLFPDREQIAWGAAACAAGYAFFVLYAATLMTETFYIVALLWAMERSANLASRPSPAGGATLGLSLGIATLLRQSILPWTLVLVVWLLWVGWRSKRLRRMVAALPVTGTVLVLCIVPFTLRNYRVYGQFLLLNSNAGYAMYSAQHPMHGNSFQEFAAAPLPEGLEGMNEAQMDRELMRLGIGFVLDEPQRYVLLSLSRIPDYFEFWPTSDTSLLHNLGRLGSFTLFLPLMVGGLWLSLRRARNLAGWSVSPLGLTILFIVFYPLMHILTWAMPRYRLPVDAVVLPFAALAIVELVQAVGRWRAGRPGRRVRDSTLGRKA